MAISESCLTQQKIGWLSGAAGMVAGPVIYYTKIKSKTSKHPILKAFGMALLGGALGSGVGQLATTTDCRNEIIAENEAKRAKLYV